MSRDYEVMIIGAGPAGCATALALARHSGRSVENILVIDKAIFPRPKLCGGGLTHTSSRALEFLGVELDINFNVIRELEIIMPKRRRLLTANDFFRTVSRESFDHLLLREVRACGIQVNEGETLLNWVLTDEAVIVRTSKGEHRAKIVVGADGANSMVRRRLGLHDPRHVAMALEISVTDPDDVRFQTPPNRATFDFRPVLVGIHGYCWKFPSGSTTSPHSLIGVGDFAYHAQPDKGALARMRKKYILDQTPHVRNVQLKGHAIRVYDPKATHGAVRFILVGDAVGTDSLWADGIGSALCMGRIAATAIEESIERDQYLSRRYESMLRASGIGRLMRARMKFSEEFYSKCAPPRYLAADWAWRHILKYTVRPSF
jgi:menaquinone-9 beta-reductase